MTRRAFTLVEILTVIVIIGILAALVTLAVAGAQRSAKKARIAVEMNQIAMALEQYKNEFGEYPPDMFDDEALVRHVRKRFPRFTVPDAINISRQADYIRQAIRNVYYDDSSKYPPEKYPPDLKNSWLGINGGSLYYNSPNNDTVISSLALWLGGFVQPNGKMQGFDADSEAPFGRFRDDKKVNDGTRHSVTVDLNPDKKTFYELEVGKNIFFPYYNCGKGVFFGFPCIASKLNSDTFAPIVYFKGRSGGGSDAYVSKRGAMKKQDQYDFVVFDLSCSWRDSGVAVPYAKTVPVAGNTEWVEAEKYQLIHPGLDGKFGSGTFRSLNTLSKEDLDNITNFSNFKELRTILK